VSWKDYLEFIDKSSYSIKNLALDLIPKEVIYEEQKVSIKKLNYELYPFQKKILDKIKNTALIIGLPTGLGKTYIAGAFLLRETFNDPKRILFLTPSVPLGVQQTLFLRKMLNIDNAFFISGNIPPEKRKKLKVWNAGCVVTTPQTFYNDFLSNYEEEIEFAKSNNINLKDILDFFKFPFDIIIADECHSYIGETDGYSVLFVGKAYGSKILALSATPQLHSQKRLEELKRIFESIEVLSIDDPEIKSFIPKRSLILVSVDIPEDLLSIYKQLADIIKEYRNKIKEEYGSEHLKEHCKEHSVCITFLALKMMRMRIVEDGASSVINYNIWKIRELREIYEKYKELIKRSFNHKFSIAKEILDMEKFEKAIIFVESVEAAKQLGVMLQKEYGIENVAILIGKEGMNLEQQASALLHFREIAKILVTTSIGEEGLDIPSADLEIWLDPPSNPKKWIQRFGRVLRKVNKKEIAKTYVIISKRTHEKRKLLGVMRKVEKIYGFTQELKEFNIMEKGQMRLTYYMR
jgi:Fanconi anemia group M protein